MAQQQDEEPDYKFFGSAIDDEAETRAGQHRKEVRDPAATRALPLHKQEVTDEQGRRRFHGAFTGGYSAGYFNTVGSKEGWQPSEFRSSRESRAAVQQSVEQYLDEDELEELRRTNLQTTQEYDTFGSTAAELARRAASDAAAERPSAIPGLLPDEMMAPVADSVGIRLLQKMGWRQGKGIGVGGDAPTPADEEAEEEEEQQAAAAGGGGSGSGAAAQKQQRRRRRWGQHVTVAADNTALYLLAPKTDVHGLGFDPFKGAEDFRRLKEQQQEAQRPGQGPSGSKKRQRGIAFGQGVLDEDDGYGGIMEDYVTHDDVDSYEETVQDDGLPLSRGPKVQKSGLGDRLARRGYSFEIMDEAEEEQGALEWHPSHPHPQQQYALPGREAALLLQSREQLVKSSLIAGFVRAAAAAVTTTFFPPPRLPPGYRPIHRPVSREAEAALPAAAAKLAPPQAEPPADAELRQAIDSLAFFVAKNGIIFENMARQRQQKEGRHAFLNGGEGAAYYHWKVHSLRSIIQPHQQQQRRQQQRAIGQRSAPLSADERGVLLGEQPLAAAAAAATAAAGQQQQQGWAAGAAAAAPGGGQAPGQQQQAQAQALGRQLLQVAEGDRQRLQQLLSRNFVAAETQDMLHPGADAAANAGLRPGAPPPPPRPAAGTAAAAAAGAKVVTGADLAQHAEGGVPAGGAAGPGASLALRPQQGPQQQQQRERQLPVRTSEEWRPVALLCKRMNVPDPYQGRPAELQMSRFRTDHLVLPDTAAAAVASSLAAVPAGAQDFLLPPTVAAALQEAEAKHLQQQWGGAAAGQFQPPPPQQGQQQRQGQGQQQDAAGAADAFLSSLSDMLGGGTAGAAGAAGGEAAPPLPSEPPPGDQQQEVEAAAAAAAERPVDLFKAIFEDSDEDEEEQEEEEGGEEEQQQQEAAAAAAQQQQQQQELQHPPLPPAPGPAHQQQQQQRWDDASFGFAKLRQQQDQQQQPPLPPGPAPTRRPPLPPAAAAAGGAAAATAAAAAMMDDALKQRVQDALRALKKDKKEKRSSKTKDKKEKREKERKTGSGKEKSSKHKKSSSSGRKEGKQHKQQRPRDSGSSSGGSSGSGSE